MNGLVTCSAILTRVLSLMNVPEFAAHEPADFIVSAVWYNQFVIRHNMYIREWTKLAQKLPEEMENKIEWQVKNALLLKMK